jgi:outer membrane protein assembly factor BamB
LKNIHRHILLLAVIVAAAVMVWWLVYNPVRSFTLSVPGMDHKTAGASVPVDIVKIGETFAGYKPSADIPGTMWPRFRGADFDNISKEKVQLIDRFGKNGPRILWKMMLGEGHAAPAVYNGNVYILDYIEAKKSDALRCISLQTGEEMWQRSYRVHLKRNHGLSRTIPAVSEKYVLTIGPRCHVMCVDRLTGNYLWGIDIAKEYKSEVPFWFTGQCPLLENDTAVIATGGTALMIGVDCKTGKKIWETPNPNGWKMSHSSIMPMILNGKKMYVYCAIGGVCGVSASGSDLGKILWKTKALAPSVVAPSPVILNNGRILITAGYGFGSAVIQFMEREVKYSVQVVQRYKPSEGLASEQQTPIFYNGDIFAILPKDAGEYHNQFVCCKPYDCKKFTMSSGKTERFGLGPYILADGKFFILNDDGELTIAKATSSDFRVLDRAKIIDGQDSWGPMVITGGYLLMRDSKQMVCLDIKAH